MSQVESGMDMPGNQIQGTPGAPSDGPEKNTRTATRAPSIIVGIVAAAVVALSVFYLLRPQPLLVQGEVDATRLDIAARVDGRVKEIPVNRGQSVPAKAVLVRIDIGDCCELEQMRTAMAVAEAQLANVLVGTRVEVIAARKAELERAQAALVLAQKSFDRTNTLTQQGNAPQARLDQMTDALHEKRNGRSIRPNQPTNKLSTAYTKKSALLPGPMPKRPMRISRAFNQSSINSWSMPPSLRRFTSAMWSLANMFRRACRSSP